MSTGSSNRLSYDECEHNQRNNQRVTPLEYQLYSGYHLTCNFCGLKGPNMSSELTDEQKVLIESELLNIDRKTSKCSANKYQPPCSDPTNCPLNSPYKFVPARVCERDVVWTNLVKPSNPGFNPDSLDAYKC
jgi:hypothetical protein